MISLYDKSFLHPEIYKNKNDFNQYANDNFITETKGFFKKKEIPAIKRAKYTRKPLRTSLTKLETPEDEKHAIQCSTFIKNYQNNGKTIYIDKILEILDQHPNLCDEIYFQLITQTQENKNKVYEMRTWQILLVISTIFPSSKRSEPVIKSYFLKHENVQKNDIANIAQLCFIRFSIRCYYNMQKNNYESAKTILYKYKNDICDFYSSVYEHLWFDRKTNPSLNIPFVLEDMVQNILMRIELCNIDQVQGIFNDIDLENIPKDFIYEYENMQTSFYYIPLKQVFNILIKWIKEQIPMFQKDIIPLMIRARNPNYFLKIIINHLDPTNRELLGYLVGFFKEVNKFSPLTGIHVSNLAKILMQSVIDFESYSLKDCMKLIFFFQEMLMNWDTTEYFPTS